MKWVNTSFKATCWRKAVQMHFFDYCCSRNFRTKVLARIRTGRKHKCEICDFRSAQKSNMKRQLDKHAREKTCSCRYCNYFCTRRYQLKLHERLHWNKILFKCIL